jgi:hypothetical protein
VVKTRARVPRAGWLGAGLAATLALGACKGPDIISLGGEVATGPYRYLSLTGDDGNPGTSDSPWKTFGHALPLLAPGLTLMVLPGTYEPGTTGTVNVRCDAAGPTSTVPGAVRAPNGELDNVITVRAQGDRSATLLGDGRVPPISIESCQHWAIEGFYATSQNVDTHATNPDTGSVAVLDGANQDVALRRLLLAHPNQYFAKAHLIRIGDGSSHVTVETNELYDFHASGIEVWRSDSAVIARNYINSRDLKDWPGADMATLDGVRGDYGVRLQETSNAYVENNVVEDVNTAFAVVGRDANVDALITKIHDNHLLANVAYEPETIGFLIDSQCAGQNPCDDAHRVTTTLLENDVAYRGGMGVYDAGSVGTLVNEVSIIQAARGVYIFKDPLNAAIQASCTVRDTLALDYQSVAFAGGPNQPTWQFDQCDASGGYDPTQAYEPDLVSNITNKVTVTPDLGSCIVYLPMKSVLRMGTISVGANILYSLDELGQPTSEVVWSPNFKGCGATVKNVNGDWDASPKPSCSDVLKKLNVNMPATASSPGCPLPP